ncbi:hypothetical protein GF367_04275 [Candidatus Woesearchaeota archaeon]|nr:hypothetical protein [Candidatus Woesearchaeota archaeon]
MGWFGLFKREQPHVTLELDEVKDWLKHYQDDVGLEHHFNIFLAEMRQHVKHTMERLDILESADLKNPNIPQRAKQAMEGHRKQYIKRIKEFIESIDIPKDYEKLTPFAEAFSEQVEQLSSDTQKNVYVLKEFLEKEAGSVAKTIGRMDRSIVDLRSTFEKLGKEKVDRAYEQLGKHDRLMERRAQLAAALKQEKEKLAEPMAKLEKIKKKVKEYTTSRGYALVQEREEELERLKEALNKDKQAIKRATSALGKAMKKLFKKTKHKEWLEKYLEDFSDALQEDEELIITKILDEIHDKFEELELTDARKDKAKKALKKTSVAWLNTQRKKLLDTKKAISSLEERLGKDTTRLLIDEQQRWQASTQEHVDNIRKNIGLIEEELSRLSPRLSLQKVRDALRRLHEKLDLKELS